MELKKFLKLWYTGCMVSPMFHRTYIWQGYDWSTGEWYTLYRYSAGEYYMRRGGGNLFRVTILKPWKRAVFRGRL